MERIRFPQGKVEYDKAGRRIIISNGKRFISRTLDRDFELPITPQPIDLKKGQGARPSKYE